MTSTKFHRLFDVFQLAPAIEHLQLSFPDFVAVEDLPLEDITNKVSGIYLYCVHTLIASVITFIHNCIPLQLDVVMRLYDRGLLLTEDLLVPDDLLDEDYSTLSEGSGDDSLSESEMHDALAE